MKELENKLIRYITPKLINEIMNCFNKDELKTRAWMRVLIINITKGFCAYHNIDTNNEASSKALNYVYRLIFDPFTLTMLENILERYEPINRKDANEFEEEVLGNLRQLGIIEGNQVYDIRKYKQ